MKSIGIFKCFCALLFLVISINISYSQNNLFNPSNDADTASSNEFYNSLADEIGSIKYFKHSMRLLMKTDLVGDNAYDLDVSNAIDAINGQIQMVYTEGSSKDIIEIRLADTMDAINYVEYFINTGLFDWVSPSVTISVIGDPSDPTDPYFTDQHYLKQPNQGGVNKDIDATKTWTITKGNQSRIRLYIQDTGVLTNSNGFTSHNDLKGSNFSYARNFCGGTWQDNVGHGTSIAGVLASTHNNNVGVAGLAPKAYSIMHKIMNSSGTNLIQWAINSLDTIIIYKRADTANKYIVNMSWAAGGDDVGLRRSIQSADTHNVICVAGANNTNSIISYPARYAGTVACVISVGATDRNDNRYSLSSYGTVGTQELSLMGPGVNIRTLSSTGVNDVRYADGTSLATPMVSGTVALMLSVNHYLSKAKIKEILFRGCDKPSGMNGQAYTNMYGNGRVNSFNSVALCLDSITGTIGSANNSNYIINSSKRIYWDATVATNCNIKVAANTTLILDKFAHLYFQSLGKITLKDSSYFIQRRLSTVHDRGEFVQEPGSSYLVEDSANFYLAGQGPNGPNDYGCMAVWGGNLIIEDNAVFTMDNGGFLTVKNGGAIYLGKNSELRFGGTSWLGLWEGGSMFFDTNAFISFKGGSWINAKTSDNSKFQLKGMNNAPWKGIFLDSNTYSDRIEDCEFTNTATPITIRNNGTSGHYNKRIKQNIFNVPENGQGIYAENIFKVAIDSNIFNLSNGAFGIFTKNYITAGPPINEDGPGSENYYQLNITNNKFYNGKYQMFLWGNTTNQNPFFVSNNKFYGNPNHSFAARKMTGDFKNNRIEGSPTISAISLWESSPNMLDNYINASGNSMNLSSSYPRLAPVRNVAGQFVWYGGRNTLISSANDNIYLSSSYPITDLGSNSFTVSNSTKYHLSGYLPDSTQAYYYCRNNCWYGYNSLPHTNLQDNAGVIQPYYQNQGYNCNHSYTGLDSYINDKGDDFYDTISITDANVNDTIPQYEVVFSQASQLEDSAKYPDAVFQYKSLISGYSGSEYIYGAVYSLYDCYCALDTFDTAEETDVLFGDLKDYLTYLIEETDSYDSEFTDIAYSTILMCETKMKNLEVALEGYEFIALYHPDPETRLLASLDYSELDAIMNGGFGGGKNGKEENEDDKKPLRKAVKEAYKEISDRRLQEGKDNNSTSINNAVNYNLRELNNLSKEERIKKSNESLELLLSIRNTSINKETSSIAPLSYKLMQNYPNPFNPTTTISYELPMDGLVRLKVYDITGKEMMTLVNEVKPAGSYQVVFNGGSLASGVYFYKIQTGSFLETKRMVLVK